MKKNEEKPNEDSPVVAKAVIFDSNGNILLLQRGDTGQKWDLPGGHVKNKEKNDDDGLMTGLKREVYEETGLKTPSGQKISQFDITWKGKTNPIHLFGLHLNVLEPEVDLTIQDFQENIDFVWVRPDKAEKYLKNCTEVLEVAISEVTSEEVSENQEPWYKRKRRRERGMKNKLVGLGGNQHIAAKGMKKSSTKRSKSPAAGAGALEEHEISDGCDKKTIKISIAKQIGEKKKKFYDIALLHGDEQEEQ